ncbi:MAG: GDSL-type esterase/lipase family protein [Ruthenibacterium lactatiformans]
MEHRNPVERTLDADVTASDARLLAVPENGRVSDDYFRDALFIGDSVTQGFAWYPEYRDWMRVCAYKGVNPQSILQNYVGQRADGTKIEMWDEINVQQDVANIYILLGANALLQQTDEGFLKFYGELLDKLRVRFPDTPIYVQSITPTTQEYGEKKPQLEREHLKLINNAIAKLAVSKGLYYVDLWEVMADENGYLRADLAGSDGLHLLDGSKYRPWLDYLAAHTIYSAHNAQFAWRTGAHTVSTPANILWRHQFGKQYQAVQSAQQTPPQPDASGAGGSWRAHCGAFVRHFLFVGEDHPRPACVPGARRAAGRGPAIVRARRLRRKAYLRPPAAVRRRWAADRRQRRRAGLEHGSACGAHAGKRRYCQRFPPVGRACQRQAEYGVFPHGAVHRGFLSQGFALYAPTRDVATVCAYKSTSPNQVLQNLWASGRTARALRCGTTSRCSRQAISMCCTAPTRSSASRMKRS